MKETDFLEDYIESIVGNKITIISGVEESEKYYTFRYCLFNDFTETVKAEINKKNFLEWVEKQKTEKPLL
jgi:hypothetical protein|nr:MAG TPA: hypothetical protein [Caudoviricetes sp.]